MNRGPKIVEGFSEGGKSRSLTLNYHDYRKCHVDIRMLQIRQTEKLGVTNSVVCLKNLCCIWQSVNLERIRVVCFLCQI